MIDPKKHPKLYAYFKLKDDCQQVFSSPEGQRVLSHLLQVGCVTTPAAAVDRDLTQQNVGAQRLVLSLLKAVYKNEDDMLQRLIQEHEKKELDI